MANPFKDQEEFMKVAGQTTTAYNKEQAVLYQRLIQEEFGEWTANIKLCAEDLKETTDLLVVLIGYLYSVGIEPQKVWDIVFENNMLKLGEKMQKREDGKILKSTASKERKNEMLKKLRDLL